MLQLITGYEFMLRLHMLAAAYWTGAIMFLVIVAAPLVGRMRPPSFQSHFARRLWRAAHLTMWIAIVILLMTGAALMRASATSPQVFSLSFWMTPFGIKLMLVGAMVVLSLVHDMLVGQGARLVDKQSTEPPGLAARGIPWVVAIGAAAIAVLSVSIGS